MIEDLPLLSVNVKIWKYFGFIKFKTYWKSIAILSMAMLLNLFEVMFLVKNWDNVEKVILSSFMVAIMFNSIVRIVSVVLNQEEFVEFMEEIAKWIQEIEESNDESAMKVLNAVTSRADKLSKLSLILGSCGAIMTIIVPLLLEEQALPYSIWIPGIDVSQSPFYEIMFIVEVIIAVPFIISTYIPFTNLFISWLMFGIACLQILQIKLENVMAHSKTDAETNEELANCIRYHIKIIRFSEKLSNMLSVTNLMEFLIFSLMLCVLLFFILIVDSYMLQVNAAIYIGCIFYVVLLFYWHANEFSYESLNVAEAAYNTDWTGGSVKLKRNISMIILRSQNALQISAGGMYPMTLETFQSLLNASYSYFSILKSMRQ